MITKVCLVCGAEFRIEPSRVTQKLCSSKCSAIFRSKANDAPCAKCGKNRRISRTKVYCRECKNTLTLQYYHKNKKCSDRKQLTPEEKHQNKLKKDGRYRAKHRQELNQKQRRYHKTHYHIYIRNIENRRARSAGVPNTLTAKEWQIIKVIYGYRCAYCGNKPKLLTKDHIVPMAKGGGHTANNIVPACKSCNSQKHIGVPPDFQPILTRDWAEIDVVLL